MKIERIEPSEPDRRRHRPGQRCILCKQVLGMEAESMGEHRAALHFGEQKIHLDAANNARPMAGDKRMPAHICFITPRARARRSWHIWNVVACRFAWAQVLGVGAIGTIQSIYIDDPDQNSIEISSY